MVVGFERDTGYLKFRMFRNYDAAENYAFKLVDSGRYSRIKFYAVNESDYMRYIVGLIDMDTWLRRPMIGTMYVTRR